MSGIHKIEKASEAENVPVGDVIIWDPANIDGHFISINSPDTPNICQCQDADIAMLVAEKILQHRIEFIELFHQLGKTAGGH